MVKTISINRQIFSLALPNIITNITIPLLGMVDTAVVGHISYDGQSSDYIGAVAVGSMIFNFIYWIFGFLRAGTSGFAAQAYGANNKNEQIDILTRGIVIALLAAFLLITIQKPIAWISSVVIENKHNVMPLALDYFFIRIWASPAVLGMYALKGWFIGMQDSKTPMWTAIVINLVNIFFDIFFVMYLHTNVKGVALATVLAQYAGLVLISIVFFKRYFKTYKINLKRSLHLNKMKRFFAVNSDIFLRSLCIIAVTTYFTIASSTMKYPTLPVNTLIMQLFMLFSYFMDGFAYACEALCGKFYGANDKIGLKTVIKKVIYIGIVLASLCAIIYGLFSKEILSILTNHQEIVIASENYKIWIILIPITGFLAFLYDGILIGLIETKILRNVMFIATIMFFGAYFLLGQTNNALWLGFILYLLARSLLMMIMSYKKIFSV